MSDLPADIPVHGRRTSSSVTACRHALNAGVAQAALEAADWNLQPAASALLARREQEAAAVAAQADYLRTPSGKLKPIAVPRHSPVSNCQKLCLPWCTSDLRCAPAGNGPAT